MSDTAYRPSPLTNAANAYAKKTDGEFEYAKSWAEVIQIFIAGAEWQRDHGKPTPEETPLKTGPLECSKCGGDLSATPDAVIHCRKCSPMPEETAPKSAQIHCAECQGRCKHIASKPAETASKETK